MSQIDPDKGKGPQAPKKTAAQIGALIGVIVGIAVFQVVGPNLFPTPPGGGFNFTRVLVAGLVGAVCAVVGGGLGALIDLARKRPRDPDSPSS